MRSRQKVTSTGKVAEIPGEKLIIFVNEMEGENWWGTSNTSTILMSGYISYGRDVVFDRNSDDIHALQRSELLDATTCNCRSTAASSSVTTRLRA
jgi:hypothetical protein